MKVKRQLLCTFSSVESFKNTIEEARTFYTNHSGKFFVFSNLDSPSDVFITYNVMCKEREFPKFHNTISIHRKKLSNTFYTLNAMNQIIKNKNGGVFDKNFSVDWSQYSNSLIITGSPEVRVIPIKILEIVD